MSMMSFVTTHSHILAIPRPPAACWVLKTEERIWNSIPDCHSKQTDKESIAQLPGRRFSSRFCLRLKHIMSYYVFRLVERVKLACSCIRWWCSSKLFDLQLKPQCGTWAREGGCAPKSKGSKGWWCTKIATRMESSNVFLSPPFKPWNIWGGCKARNFWEIFHLTTWNIPPPTYFFGLLKDVGGGSSGRCSFLDLFSPYAGRAHAQTLTTR